MIDSLAIVHDAGYIHNDIKPTNIMADCGLTRSKHQLQLETDKIHASLIDFGFASKYIEKKSGKKVHIEQEEVAEFKGSLIFSSRHQMEFKSTSRRDDLISLCYTLLIMLNKFNFPCNSDLNPYGVVNESNMNSKFKDSLSHKKATTLHDMTKNLTFFQFSHDHEDLNMSQKDFFENLAQFAKSIDSLEFKERPDYEGLKKNLSNCERAL